MYTDTTEANDTGFDDLFMKDFKRYRQLKSFSQSEWEQSDIISLKNDAQIESYIAQSKLKTINLNLEANDEDMAFKYGLQDLSEWRCYELIENPGFFVIPNPFRPGYQRFLVKKCLSEYHNQPNKTNLDLHMKREGINLWKEALSTGSFADFNKLRWTTIGYHYDWTAKVYNENDFTPVPSDIEAICKYIATSLSFSGYRPEAGIINYYHLNSTLSGHQDHSEKNMQAPLISISLGNQAIFLIGKRTKSIRPNALCLNSGDICIMSGQSRLSYHGVPKILKDKDIQDYFAYEEKRGPSEDFQKSSYFVGEQEWARLSQYISINRINLNIRQVY